MAERVVESIALLMMSSSFDKLALSEVSESPLILASTGKGSQDEENDGVVEDEVNNPLRNHPIGSWGTGLFECPPIFTHPVFVLHLCVGGFGFSARWHNLLGMQDSISFGFYTVPHW